MAVSAAHSPPVAKISPIDVNLADANLVEKGESTHDRLKSWNHEV